MSFALAAALSGPARAQSTGLIDTNNETPTTESNCLLLHQYPPSTALSADDHLQIFWMTPSEYADPSLCSDGCDGGLTEGVERVQALSALAFLSCGWSLLIEGIASDDIVFDNLPNILDSAYYRNNPSPSVLPVWVHGGELPFVRARSRGWRPGMDGRRRGALGERSARRLGLRLGR